MKNHLIYPTQQQMYTTRPAELVRQFEQALKENFEQLLNGEVKDVYEVEEFADLLHVHPVHLSNTLKKETGKSPCDWVNEYFITEAKHLLLHTSLTIAQIAYKLSFHEATNFTKYFKRHTGVSPKNFRLLKPKAIP